ncbi:MAG: HAD family hydrolase [Planctomycetes bacterium]|nr:HAD family hydrolase [Planctomycetota bacterium]
MSRLFVSDLDGTLLQPDATLSAFAREGLARLISDGLAFTVASARNINNIQTILGDLPLQFPVIGHNGACISDLANGKHILYLSLDSEIAQSIIERALGEGHYPFLSTYDGVSDHLYYEKATNYGMEWYVRDRTEAQDPRLKKLDDIYSPLAEEVSCVNFVGRHADLLSLEQWLAESFAGSVRTIFYENMYCPGWWWLTVYHPESSKAHALGKLSEMTGIGLEDITVFGDAINDVPMFEVAGRRIAVENADEHLRPYADEFIGPNTEDSVVKYLSDYSTFKGCGER